MPPLPAGGAHCDTSRWSEGSNAKPGYVSGLGRCPGGASCKEAVGQQQANGNSQFSVLVSFQRSVWMSAVFAEVQQMILDVGLEKWRQGSVNHALRTQTPQDKDPNSVHSP